MKRKPTEAQKSRAAERRAKVRELLKKIAAMTPEQQTDLTNGTIMTVEHRPLSLRNQCLVAMQGCRSTIVGGFQQWRRVGRIVRKGQHGFSIWIPSATKDEETGKDDLRFFLGTVFGIDQTDEIEVTS